MVEVEKGPVIKGLPADVVEVCLAKLTLHEVASSRVVCRSWASVLRKYTAARLRQPHFLAFFLLGHDDDDFVTWLFLSRSGLRVHRVRSFFTRGAEMNPNIFTSRMQIITTGTPMLLVRATFCLGSSGNGAHSGSQDGSLSCMPGALQGFDLWHMRWLTPSETLWSPMPVDRYGFAAAHVGKHVYFAGGDGFMAAKSAERLSLETWTWEMLPPMHVERTFHPSGFAMMDRFFIVGGELHSMLSTLPQTGEFYDPITNSWTLVPGMWPHELWCAGGTPQSITVVNDVAYAIDTKLQAVVQLKVEDHPFRVEWLVVGKLPWADLDKASMLWMQCLVNEGKEKLWAILKNRRDHEWFVFTCIPHLAKQGLVWEHLPFVIPASYQYISSTCKGILL
ncbi:hypothetical protein L7F22_035565 [Adiantum nelumboides]|nr:hypothetical protein [Adiantum nelumboides]